MIYRSAQRFWPTAAVCLLLLGATAGCQTGSAPDSPPTEEAIPFRKDGELTLIQEGVEVITLDIEIAATDSSRGRGLMQRRSLPAESGMLFVFPEASLQGFYMANTSMSLDFFFIGADSVVVNTVKYAAPLSLDTIASTGPVLWVLEVPAGFIDTYGLVSGDRVSWGRTGE
ncbi:MAG: uncharacterized membrane protein (UPF0127 family) [Rhodothermales bacterium]|jgi:uncharacterized membrane protein (UPF0127 family)